jgi:hypothetical protein
MHQGCKECERLWREYSAATAEHVRLDLESRQAVAEGNQENAEVLTEALHVAGKNRERLRRAIHVHEARAEAKTSSQCGS